jgi:hypothetical protein
MMALAKLLSQKEQLIGRPQDAAGPEEREQIECLLEQINAALDAGGFVGRHSA